MFIKFILCVVFSFFRKFSWVTKTEMGTMRPISPHFVKLVIDKLCATQARFKDVLRIQNEN